MNKAIYLIIFCFIILTSCQQKQEARRPITTATSTFFKESVARNKKILAKEETIIEEIIHKDSTNLYISSADGFWYTYVTKDTLSTYTPQENDIVVFEYDVKKLNNMPIYTKENIGVTSYKVDKENLFPGMQKAIKLLKKNEEAIFLFPSSLAYGYYGDQKKIGVNVPLKTSIHILDIQKVTDSIQIKTDSIQTQ